jgi:hypothetical protein
MSASGFRLSVGLLRGRWTLRLNAVNQCSARLLGAWPRAPPRAGRQILATVGERASLSLSLSLSLSVPCVCLSVCLVCALGRGSPQLRSPRGPEQTRRLEDGGRAGTPRTASADACTRARQGTAATTREDRGRRRAAGGWCQRDATWWGRMRRRCAGEARWTRTLSTHTRKQADIRE